LFGVKDSEKIAPPPIKLFLDFKSQLSMTQFELQPKSWILDQFSKKK